MPLYPTVPIIAAEDGDTMLNENIKQARKAKGMSQEMLAVQLNVVRQTVSKWENGLSVPDADVLIQIADLLEVPVSRLLGVSAQEDTVQDLTEKLAELNRELAVTNQQVKRRQLAEKKRNIILFFALAAMLVSLNVGNPLLSLGLSGGCLLMALAILYRNLGLMTDMDPAGAKMNSLRLTTLFNVAAVVVVVAVFMGPATFREHQLFEMVVLMAVILFGGFISPKLPFNRHTGLRLPWTVCDEETWNVAHRIMGYISLPLILLYTAVALTVDDFLAASAGVVLLWVGIPAVISLVFFWRKSHGK